MKTTIRHIPLTALGLALILTFSCSDGGPSGVSSDRVSDPWPLELGNSWDYSLEQNAFITRDTPPYNLQLTSYGSQKVSITRTEAITGDEAFGVRIFHVMEYMLSEGADSTVEIHYLARRGDKILLKAVEYGYNTGGFIPFGTVAGTKQRLLAKVSTENGTRYLPIEQLARALLNPESSASLKAGGGPSLASDGIQNNENADFYSSDYILLYDDLYKGRAWISSAAQSVGGIEISRRVTNVLPALSGFEGPIAEVEETNSLIESSETTSYKLRFYYKGGLGIVQAEIYDTDFDFYVLTDEGIDYLGRGTWQVVKKLQSYTVK